MKTYKCFKSCGFTTTGPTGLFSHYRDNADHRPPYWDERHAKSPKKVKTKRTNHLSVVRGRKTGLSLLRARLQAEIDKTQAQMEKLKFAQGLIDGRL